MLYVILLATFSAVFGQNQYCYYYNQCGSQTLTGDTISCVAPYACVQATLTADIVECGVDFSCYLATSTATVSVSCGGLLSCYNADLTVTPDDCDETGIIYCSASNGAACTEATLSADSVVCDGSDDACAGATITTNSLDCGRDGACEATTVTFDGSYNTLSLDATRSGYSATFTQSDGDSTSSNTLDVFYNAGWAAGYGYIYSGDYNYMNVYYNYNYAGTNGIVYCEAYATCVFYCSNPYYCSGSIAYVATTATYSTGGLYSPTIYSYTASEAEDAKLKAQNKQEKLKAKLISEKTANKLTEEEAKNFKGKGETHKELSEKYNIKKEEKTQFINKMKKKLAKNSGNNLNNNSTMYIIAATLIISVVISLIIGYVLGKYCNKNNKGIYQPLRQPNLQYV